MGAQGHMKHPFSLYLSLSLSLSPSLSAFPPTKTQTLFSDVCLPRPCSCSSTSLCSSSSVLKQCDGWGSQACVWSPGSEIKEEPIFFACVVVDPLGIQASRALASPSLASCVGFYSEVCGGCSRAEVVVVFGDGILQVGWPNLFEAAADATSSAAGGKQVARGSREKQDLVAVAKSS